MDVSRVLLISNCLFITGYITFYLIRADLNYGNKWDFERESPKENTSKECGSSSQRNSCENLDHRSPHLTESWTEKSREKASEVDLPGNGYRYRGQCQSHCQFMWLMNRILFQVFARKSHGQLNIRNPSGMKMILNEMIWDICDEEEATRNELKVIDWFWTWRLCQCIVL